MNKGFSTKKISALAMLTAISIVLVLILRFPIIPSAPFLEYDPADIPIFLGTFMYGPIAGLILTVIVSLIQGLTVSAGSGFIGILMHIFSTGTYVLVAGFIYKYKKSFKGAILAMVCGSIVMVGAMILWNIVFTPIFLGVPRQVVYSMILPAILPFNIIKVSINSIATILLYKQTKKFFNFVLTEKKNNNVNKIMSENKKELPDKED